MENKLYKLALDEAAKSTAKKRKVGAVIVDNTGEVIGLGHNYNASGACEDSKGNTLIDTVHAEVAAIESIREVHICYPLTMFVTHQPCKNCQSAILKANIDKVVVVPTFLKFDTGKLRYDLVPPSAIKALASALTYGAKKYKPENWRNNEDKDRFIAATMRHFEDYRAGNIIDEESNLPHLALAMTNIAFLLELNYKPAKKKRNK